MNAIQSGTYPQVKLLPVTPNSPEWNELVKLTRKFGLAVALKQAERIQNPKLWDVFLCREQELLKQRYKNKAKAVSKLALILI